MFLWGPLSDHLMTISRSLFTHDISLNSYYASRFRFQKLFASLGLSGPRSTHRPCFISHYEKFTGQRSLPTSSTSSPTNKTSLHVSRITLTVTKTQITRHPHEVHNLKVHFTWPVIPRSLTLTRYNSLSCVHLFPINQRWEQIVILDSRICISWSTSVTKIIIGYLSYIPQICLGAVGLTIRMFSLGSRKQKYGSLGSKPYPCLGVTPFLRKYSTISASNRTLSFVISIF